MRIYFVPHKKKEPLFVLGQVVATPAASAALEKSGQKPSEFLSRHASGDWGNLSDGGREENLDSLKHGLRLLSSYRTKLGDELWIITEGHRSVTTILLPNEYEY